MAHTQKPVFVFRPNGRVHLNRFGGGGQFSRLLADELCTSACKVCTAVQACVLQSCDAYRLPTPFSCFPFTSLLRHRVPSHFKRSIPSWKPTSVRMRWILKGFACKCTENSNCHKCLSARRPQPPWYFYGQTYCTVLICLRFYWLSILVNCIGRDFNVIYCQEKIITYFMLSFISILIFVRNLVGI
jgi:hypothetical protein